MRDWNRFVRDHLPPNQLTPECEEDVIEELGQQLENSFQESLAGGASEEEAAEYARSRIPDWEAFARDLLDSSPGRCRSALDRWNEHAETAAVVCVTRGLLARLLADFRQDLLYGIRLLVRSPGFTAAALLTLAFGIGINTAVFTVMNATVSVPEQYPDSRTLVYFWGTTNPGTRSGAISAADVSDWQSRSSSFAEWSVFRSKAKTWRGEAETERVRAVETTTSLFALLGLRPSLGRLLPAPGDSTDEGVVVVADGFWRTRLGADPGVIGKTYLIDGVHHTVVGVLEPTRKLEQLFYGADLLLPLPRDAASARRDERSYQVLARLKAGIAPAAAQAEMDGIAANLSRAYPDTNAKSGVRLESLEDRLVSPADRAMSAVLLLTVAAVLLIACMNLANMLLAKATNRTRDFAIRLALGAGRMRIVRQLLAESLLLALAGGALGLLLSHGASRVFVQSMDDGSAPFTLSDLAPNMDVLLYTLGISLATAVVFGLAPAAMLIRIPVAEAVKEAGSAGLPGLSRNRLRRALVVAQLSLGLPLLVGCGLAVRNVQGLSTAELGFDARNLLTMYVELPDFRYSEKERWPAVFQDIVARVRALPGVQAAGAVLSFPVGAGAHSRMVVKVRVEGGATPGVDPSRYFSCQPVTPGYFEAMRIPLLAGRRFGEGDAAGSTPVAMINRQMAISFFGNPNPVGRLMILDEGTDEERRAMIVGVAGDSGRGVFGEPPTSEIYLPYAQSPLPGMVMAVRTAGDPLPLVPALRRSLRELDPDIPIAEVKTVPEIVHRWLRDDRMLAVFLAILAVLSLGLASLGLYGVMSYAVNQRSHEIGVRMALGADAAKILRVVLRQCLTLSLTGIGIGFLISVPVALLLGSQFYGVGGIDFVTFAAVTVLLFAVAALAGYFPARRATRVDPIQALRHQ